jgi:hypothetical protein
MYKPASKAKLWASLWSPLVCKVLPISVCTTSWQFVKVMSIACMTIKQFWKVCRTQLLGLKLDHCSLRLCGLRRSCNCQLQWASHQNCALQAAASIDSWLISGSSEAPSTTRDHSGQQMKWSLILFYIADDYVVRRFS